MFDGALRRTPVRQSENLHRIEHADLSVYASNSREDGRLTLSPRETKIEERTTVQDFGIAPALGLGIAAWQKRWRHSSCPHLFWPSLLQQLPRVPSSTRHESYLLNVHPSGIDEGWRHGDGWTYHFRAGPTLRAPEAISIRRAAARQNLAIDGVVPMW